MDYALKCDWCSQTIRSFKKQTCNLGHSVKLCMQCSYGSKKCRCSNMSQDLSKLSLNEGTPCAYCQKSEGKIMLQCKKHLVCRVCCDKSADYNCKLCPTCGKCKRNSTTYFSCAKHRSCELCKKQQVECPVCPKSSQDACSKCGQRRMYCRCGVGEVSPKKAAEKPIVEQSRLQRTGKKQSENEEQKPCQLCLCIVRFKMLDNLCKYCYLTHVVS